MTRPPKVNPGAADQFWECPEQESPLKTVKSRSKLLKGATILIQENSFVAGHAVIQITLPTGLPDWFERQGICPPDKSAGNGPQFWTSLRFD